MININNPIMNIYALYRDISLQYNSILRRLNFTINPNNFY